MLYTEKVRARDHGIAPFCHSKQGLPGNCGNPDGRICIFHRHTQPIKEEVSSNKFSQGYGDFNMNFSNMFTFPAPEIADSVK